MCDYDRNGLESKYIVGINNNNKIIIITVSVLSHIRRKFGIVVLLEHLLLFR